MRTTLHRERCLRCGVDIEPPKIEGYEIPGPSEMTNWDICDTCNEVIDGDEREALRMEAARIAQIQLVEMLRDGTLEKMEAYVAELEKDDPE